MGMPMAANLLRNGHAVVGFRRGDATNFHELGGIVARSPREVAERSEIVLCCIPDAAALEDVISGPRGISSGDCSGRIVAELSTLSTEVKSQQADRLARRGGVMLDGAISGLPPMVAARRATFLLSGDEEAYSKAKPVLATLTDKLFFLGPFGSALKAKLCANLLVAANLAAIAEMLSFATKVGLDHVMLIEALEHGAGGSVQFTARAERMSKGDWDVVLGSTDTLTKDIHLIEAAAKKADCPMPVVASITALYEQAHRSGYGDKDVASLYAVIARNAGLAVPDAKKDHAP
jgi:3-hydroxyisobutyrate dehydrogenase-like beta-hydroxyacid dehydrogenase